MPIFEYRCEKCDSEFEKLVFGSAESADIHCPVCDSPSVEQLYSAFSGVARGSDGSTRAITSSGGCASCASSNCASCGGH
jgi:putative FmdB family regulatory protein